MARIRQNYTFKEDKPKPSLYPWHEWTDGHIWEARQGRDYTTSTKSFKDSLKYQAKTRRMTLKLDVSTFRGAEVVIFQYLKTRTNPVVPATMKTQTIKHSTSKKKPAGRRKPARIGLTIEERAILINEEPRATDAPASVAEMNGETVVSPFQRRTITDNRRFRGGHRY